jgi:hypothetical protein
MPTSSKGGAGIALYGNKDYFDINSLSFKELFKRRIDKQIIVHPKGYSEADGVIKIPPYMMHLTPAALRDRDLAIACSCESSRPVAVT